MQAFCSRPRLRFSATTYISVEPIPNRDVVGQDALAKILSVGYPNLELWSNRLLNDCGIVQKVIDVLASNGAISTVNPGNTSFRVAAGGFEAVTNPSYVFTVQDSGPNAVSAADIDVLDNALGYVLNQGGTAHFSPDNAKAYDFSLDYAVVTFAGRSVRCGGKRVFRLSGHHRSRSLERHIRWFYPDRLSGVADEQFHVVSQTCGE